MMKDYARNIKQRLNNNFRRHNAIMHEIQDQYEEKTKQLEAREEKHSQDILAFRRTQKSEISKRKAQRDLKKRWQSRSYSDINYGEQLGKMKVLQKHQKISLVADELSRFKESISQRKKLSNFDIHNQRVRYLSQSFHNS